MPSAALKLIAGARRRAGELVATSLASDEGARTSWERQRARKRPTATGREAATLLVLGPSVALTEARTAGVSFFERSAPLHCVLLGRCRFEVRGRLLASPSSLAIPAGTRWRVDGGAVRVE